MLFTQKVKPEKRVVRLNSKNHLFISEFFHTDKYTDGLRVCPLKFPQDRAVLYANRGQMKRVMGLNDLAIKNCTKAIELNPKYLKALLRRAEIYEETDKLGKQSHVIHLMFKVELNFSNMSQIRKNF